MALLNPDQLTRGEYLKKQEEYQKKRALLAVYRDRETVDADGKRYGLYANIGSPAEAEAAAAAGAEGVGLFRTEFLFMDRTSVPSETEQMEAYQAVSRTMAGKEVIIRTLDVGGDKAIDYLGMDKEENPSWAIGPSATAWTAGPVQGPAAGPAAAGAELRNIKIMLPLVTSLEEIRGAGRC